MKKNANQKFINASKKLAFVREQDSCWYIDLPHWIGSHANLQMVCGADRLLEYLHSEDRVQVYVYHSASPVPELDKPNSGWIRAERTDYHIKGSTYSVHNLPDYTRDFWICPVTLFVLHEYPRYIYLRPAEGCKTGLL